MNVFLPQSVQAQIELEEIADVKRQIITPALSMPIIGIVQDCLLGSYNLTAPTMRIDWRDAMNIISYTSLDDFSSFKKNKEYTGAELFSMIIPANISSKNSGLEVVNSVIKSGQVTKSHLGSKKSNSLIHLIWDEYGADETKNFLDNVQRLVNNFNLLNGFTVGVGDIDIPLKLEEDLHKLFEKKKLEVDHLITEIENNPDLMDQNMFELSIYNDLNALRGDVSKMIMENLKDTNNFKIMKQSGSKGDEVNIGQMGGCLGQQAVEGKRIQKKVNNRSLPYFFQNDDSAKARGFIENSFLRGTAPSEFMFHNMSSREGLIDTAIKSVTGDTPIIILENNDVKYINIGDWIDTKLKESENMIKHETTLNMELLDLDNETYIPTTDENGTVSWGKITAITRHDPTEYLYKIKTHGGRTVTVAESKSVLIWDESDHEFKPKSMTDVKNGDYMPTTMRLPSAPIEKHYIDVMIPDKFKLNEENGIFIGLFLAEGNVDINSGYVQITNNDYKIINFVKKWFDNHSIKYTEDVKINNIGGTSSQIRGFSTTLAKFLTKLLGHGAKNKYVPDDAYIAPVEFIKGLLNGYISSDGTVTKNSIVVGSASEKLIYGISMLCTKLNIFGKITKTIIKSNNLSTENPLPRYELSIRCQWAKLFADNITLIEENKNNKLKEFKLKQEHIYFPTQKDVVLDKIVEIIKISSKEYPKVYDLTVPSTTNFGLANGLHVVDTAESGYIQRKLVKCMEDAMVKYDLTVRNANNSIIQFIYGDSGIDSTKQYEHKLNILKMGNQEIKDKYMFTDSELKNFSFTSKQNKDYYTYLLQLRDEMRNSKIKISLNYIIFENTFMLPVNLDRIIDYIKDSEISSDEILEPNYIIDRLENILDYSNTKIICMSNADSKDSKSIKYKDEMLAKTLFKLALHEYLAPKVSIFNLKLNKVKFDKICNEIIDGFNKSVTEPGEMTGTISAQSIGEPVTQMSVPYKTQIQISGDINYSGPIGKFIDNLLKENKNDVITFGKHSILNLIDIDYKIIGVSDKEKTSWNKILQVTRHPANGGLVKVTTRSGKETTATLSHSFLKRTKDGITTINGSELKLGHRIPVAKYIPTIESPIEFVNIGNKNIKLDKEFGWLCGAYIADGYINYNTITISKVLQESEDNIRRITKQFNIIVNTKIKQGQYGPSKDIYFNNKDIANFLDINFGNSSYNKQIPSFVYSSNLEYIKGIIQGYFDGDGNINLSKQQICCGSHSEKLMESMCLLLAYCGIFTSKLQEKTKHQSGKLMYTIAIQKKYAQLFKDQIGLTVKYKLDELNKIINYNRQFKHSNQDNIDQIPELSETIATIEMMLKLPNQSRTYKRWLKKEAIGRNTLIEYISRFKNANKSTEKIVIKKTVDEFIQKLEQAVNSDVIWDEIVKLEYLDDPKEYVYDFTVPGNDSFMVDCGVLVHNTLNTFHHAGIGGKGTATLGVARIKELLSFSSNIKTPMMMIYLNEDIRNNVERANKIASYIKYTTLEDLRDKVDIYYDPNPYEKDGFMERDNVYNIFYGHNPGRYSCQSDISSLPWLIRIVINKEMLLQKDITLLDVKTTFCNNWERRYRDNRGMNKIEKQLLEKITQTAILSNSDNDKVPIVHLRFDMTEFDFSTIIAFLDTFIESLKLKGLEGITKINDVSEEQTVSFNNENQELKTEKQQVIYTAGVNMVDIRYINGVDIHKTICNDVVQIYNEFGIEAARMSLLNEIRTVFEGAGNKVNFQHISILIDIMTNNGTLTQIDRHGLNRIEIDPLARASFEKTVEQLINAAVFGEVDHMKSVSSRIMAGLVINGGTGLCNIVLDTLMLENSEYIEDIDHKYKKTFIELTEDPVASDIIDKETTTGFIPM